MSAHDWDEERLFDGGLPGAWAETPPSPRWPGGDVGVCRTDQGTMFYDRETPGRYLIGPAVDLEEVV